MVSYKLGIVRPCPAPVGSLLGFYFGGNGILSCVFRNEAVSVSFVAAESYALGENEVGNVRPCGVISGQRKIEVAAAVVFDSDGG